MAPVTTPPDGPFERATNLAWEVVGDEAVVVDTEAGTAHALTPAAADAFRALGTPADPAQLAARTGTSADALEGTLADLAGRGLVRRQGHPRYTRRAVLAGTAGAAAVTVTSIVLPTPAVAASRPTATPGFAPPAGGGTGSPPPGPPTVSPGPPTVSPGSGGTGGTPGGPAPSPPPGGGSGGPGGSPTGAPGSGGLGGTPGGSPTGAPGSGGLGGTPTGAPGTGGGLLTGLVGSGSGPGGTLAFTGVDTVREVAAAAGLVAAGGAVVAASRKRRLAGANAGDGDGEDLPQP